MLFGMIIMLPGMIILLSSMIIMLCGMIKLWSGMIIMWRGMIILLSGMIKMLRGCATKAIFYCPSMNSHRPRSQNTAKERALIPEKDSKRKRPRLHVSREKSSKNYKPLEKWAKPNLLPDVTPKPANFSGNYFRRICHVVEPDLP